MSTDKDGGDEIPPEQPSKLPKPDARVDVETPFDSIPIKPLPANVLSIETGEPIPGVPFPPREPGAPSTFKRFRNLKCYKEAHTKILEGWPLKKIAIFIQDERDEYTDVSPNYMVNLLTAYRDSLPPAELISMRLPKVMQKAVKKLEEGVDEVKELERLAMFQKRRMKIDGDTEKKIGKLLPSMTQEVRVMTEILRTLKDTKMDLGINTRHIGQLDIDSKSVSVQYNSEAVGKVLDDTKSRQKLLSVAEKFMALAAIKDTTDTVDAETVSSDTAPATPLDPKDNS